MITGRNELDEREIRAVRRGYRFTRTFYSWQVFMPLGRVGRKRYWLAMLGLWLPIVVFLLLVDPLDRWLSQEAIRASRDTVQVIFFTYLVLILIPSFSLTVRRYHDVNYPGVKCALILPFYIVCWPLFMLMRLWWSWIKPVQIAMQLQQRGSTLISVTNNANSVLARMADCNISYHVAEAMVNERNVTTQIPVIYTLETLAKKIYNKNSQ